MRPWRGKALLHRKSSAAVPSADRFATGVDQSGFPVSFAKARTAPSPPGTNTVLPTTAGAPTGPFTHGWQNVAGAVPIDCDQSRRPVAVSSATSIPSASAMYAMPATTIGFATLPAPERVHATLKPLASATVRG
jgi:hypothetical protein